MDLLPLTLCPRISPAASCPRRSTWATGARLLRSSTNSKPARKRAPPPPTWSSWLLDWSELSAALDEESSKRYIAMTCHTDNAEAERAYLHFVENVEPQIKPRQFKLAQTYVSASAPRAVAEGALPGVRPGHPGPGRAVPAGECAAGDRGGPAEPAISEAQRLAHRAVPRRREDAGADGPLPGRARPRAAPGSVGTGRQPPACRRRRSSRRSSTSS